MMTQPHSPAPASRRGAIFLAILLVGGCKSCPVPADAGPADAGPTDGGTCGDTWTLDNGRLALTFARRANPLDSSRAALGLTQFRSRDGVVADVSRSLLWQVDLRTIYPGDSRFMSPTGILFPSFGQIQAEKGLYVPIDSASLESCTNSSIVLHWSALDVGQSDRLDVKVSVALRPKEPEGDGRAEWNISLALTGNGARGIHDVKFPLLVMPQWGPSAADDSLLMPQELGVLFRHPLQGLGLLPDDETAVPFKSPFALPGNDAIASYLAYYGGPGEGGLQVTAEDTRRYYKR